MVPDVRHEKMPSLAREHLPHYLLLITYLGRLVFPKTLFTDAPTVLQG
jgi:hypothetical protein